MLESREANNSKILIWINNFVEQLAYNWQNMRLQKQFGIIWHCCTHNQTLQNNINWSLIFEQCNKRMSTQEFYSTMFDLWDQLELTEPASLQSNVEYLTRRERQRLVEFLMALRNDFEGLRGNILHRCRHPLC